MSYTLYTPVTVEEALRLQRETNGHYLAGGTVMLVNAHKGRDIGNCLIAIEKIPSLHGITMHDGFLTIGACVTFDEIEQSAIVRDNAYALWQAAREVGGPQIRNRATLGGNIAVGSPASDGATPLLALNAILSIAGENSVRRLPLRDFYLGKFQCAMAPGELITSVSIPVGAKSAFRKVGKRSALAVSCLCLAVARRENGVDVAAGAVASRPMYCEKSSAALRNGITSEAIEQAVSCLQTEIAPITDRWGDAEYKKRVCVNLLRQMLTESEVLQ